MKFLHKQINLLKKNILIQEYHVKIKIYKKHTCTGTNVVSDIQVSFHYTQMLWQITEEKKGQVILWRNSHFPSQVVMTINLFHLIESSRAYSFQEYMYYPTNYLLVSIFTNFLQGLGFWYSKRDSLLKILYLLRLLLRYRKTKCQLNMA